MTTWKDGSSNTPKDQLRTIRFRSARKGSSELSGASFT